MTKFPRMQQAWTDLVAWRIAVALVVAGGVLLWLAEVLAGGGSKNALEAAVQGAGSAVLIAGAISLLWDLRGKRALSHEVLAAAGVAQDVRLAGLVAVRGRYVQVEWEALFKGARQIDLFFAYAATWRNTHASELRIFVAKPGNELRVVLPALNNPGLMGLLAAKFGCDEAELIRRIGAAEADVEQLALSAHSTTTVSIKRTVEFPVFTYYRFDETTVGVLYAQAPGRADVPAFVSEGGTLGSFFEQQFQVLWDLATPPDDDPVRTSDASATL